MITVQDASLIGFGELFSRRYQSQEALLPWGNTTELKVSHTEEQQKLRNFITGSGNRNSVSQVTDVQVAFTVYDLNPRNLALVGRGTIKGVAAGEVQNEPQACEGVLGELIPFDNLPDLSVSPVIKTTGDVALAAGDDYLLTPYGIQVLSTAKITSAGVKCTYTKLKADVVHMLTTSASELEMYFAGLNTAQNGAPMPARLRRLKIGLVQEIQLSGTAFAALSVTGELLADPLVTASDMSQFYTLGQKAA